MIQLTKQGLLQYALSDELTLRRGNDLFSVLSILKRFAGVSLQQ